MSRDSSIEKLGRAGETIVINHFSRKGLLVESSVDQYDSQKDMLVNGSPEINTGKQVELAKTLFESSLNNLREVSELVTKSGFEVFDVLNKRASESIEEITSYSPAPSKKKSA